MAELISAYKPSCCNKAYISKSSAVRHEKKCPKNPKNRACQTCKHRIETTETYYNPYHNGDCGSTDYDYKCWWCEIHDMKIDSFSANVDGIGMQPKMNCEHWERTPQNDEVRE